MRKKLPEEEKKKSISVSLHPDLIELLEKYATDSNKSKIIEKLVRDHFEKNKK